MQLVAVDVGNSAIKYGVAHNAAATDWVSRGRIPGNGDFEFELPDSPVFWVVTSVNRVREKALQQWISRHRANDVVRLILPRDVPVEIAVAQPDHVGRDRLASAFAAYSAAETSGNSVVVDAGTAITVDAIDGEGRFLGGMIAPGPRSCLRQLALATDALPDLSGEILSLPSEIIGRCTESAIRSGVFFAQAGGIREMVRQTARQMGGSCRVFLTGGAIGEFVPQFPTDWLHIDDLTLRGIREIASRMHDS